MKNFIPVNVVVGDRTYRIKIKAEDEEMVRKISKKLNEQVNSFKVNYAGKDMQDYIAMALLWFVSENHENGEKIKTDDNRGRLAKIEEDLDKSLEEHV
jgi:cell division protein ZapA